MWLPSTMSAAEKRVLKELVTLFEKSLFICNPFVKDFITYKDIKEEDLGSETRIIFHEDSVPSSEHERRYKIPRLSELCIEATDLDDGVPPLIVGH